MDPLELKLKRALEAQDPPEGFAERVVQRSMDQPTRPRSAPERRWAWPWQWNGWLSVQGWRAALAGGLAVTILGVGIAYHQHQERVRGEQARAQLMLALQITGKQIHRVHNVLVEQPGGVRE